jgi:hypothetical protein
MLLVVMLSSQGSHGLRQCHVNFRKNELVWLLKGFLEGIKIEIFFLRGCEGTLESQPATLPVKRTEAGFSQRRGRILLLNALEVGADIAFEAGISTPVRSTRIVYIM